MTQTLLWTGNIPGERAARAGAAPPLPRRDTRRPERAPRTDMIPTLCQRHTDAAASARKEGLT